MWFYSMTKTQGARVVNPAQETLSSSLITSRWDLISREDTPTGVLFPVLKEIMQKYLLLSCITCSSLQCVDRDASISAVPGMGNPAILDEQFSPIRERRGIPHLDI